MIERAAEGEGEGEAARDDGLPCCSLANLQSATCQLIDDMEDQMGVPDRQTPTPILCFTHVTLVSPM
jgi:hypothetical protein